MDPLAVSNEQGSRNGDGQGVSAGPAQAVGDHPTHCPYVTVKDLFWLVYLYPVRWCAAMLPPELFVRAGMLLDPVCRFLAGKTGRRIESILEAALGITERESRLIARRFFRSTLRRSLDDLVIDRLAKRGQWRCTELRGLENLERASSDGRGVILVTGHFHATRLVKRYLADQGYPVLSIRNGEPPDRAAGVLGLRWLQPRYVRLLGEVIRDEVMLQDRELTLKVMRRLRSGGIVNVHLDTIYSVETLTHPFLGLDWSFPAGFLRIAAACGAAIVPMSCHGDGSGFSVCFEPEHALWEAGDAEQFARLNLPDLIGRLECQVRAHPDQWDAWVWI